MSGPEKTSPLPDDNGDQAAEGMSFNGRRGLYRLVGWAVGCMAAAYGIYKISLLATDQATGESACLLAAGIMLLLGLHPLVRAARAPWTEEPDPAVGLHWTIALSSLAACTGCLWAASQHATSGYYLLSGMMVFFAACLTALIKQVDRYLSLPQIAVVLGIQAASLVSLIGP